MRIISYELCKIIKNRKVFLFIMAMLFFNIAVFVLNQQGSSPYEYRKYSKEFQQEMQEITYSSTEEGIEKITKFQELANDFQFHNAYALKIFTEEDVEEYHAYLESTYGNGAAALADKQNKDMTIEQSCGYVYFAGEWIKQLQYQQQYVEFRNQIAEGNSNTASLFQKDKSFTKKNEEKTKKAYEKLGNITLKVGNQFPAKRYLKYSYSAIFLIGILIVLVMGVFRVDQEKQMIDFLKTQKKGRNTLLCAKLATLGILVVCNVFLMEFLLLFTSYVLYGSFDWLMPIQNLESYRNCCVSWNIAQFILVGILIKCIVGYVMGIFIACLVLRFEKNWVVYLSTVGICAVEWLLYEKILSNESLAILKYANIMQGIASFKLLGNYENCNLFGFPVNKCLIALLFLGILWIVGVLQSYIFWKLPKEQKEGRKIREAKKIGRISLFNNVFQIYFFHEKKYLICMAMLAYGLYCAFFQSVTTMPTTLTQTSYEEWVQEYQGELTSEKESAIEKEKKNYDKLWKRVAELGYKEKLSAEETAELSALNTKTGIPYDAFCEFLEQYDIVKTRKEEGKDARLLNTYCWQRLFNGSAKEVKNMGIACAFCILLCASLFENKRNVNTLLDTTRHGRKKLCRCKYLLGMEFAIMAWACCVLPEFIRFIRTNPGKDWDASIGNLMIFQNVNAEIPIYIMVIGMYIAQLVLCLFCSLAIMYLVDRTNNSFLSMTTLGIFIMVVFIMLYHNKMGVIDSWMISSKYPLTPCFLEIGTCIFLGMLIVFYWEREWRYLWKTNRKIRRFGE